MDYELVVRQAFGDYAVGDQITDPAAVTKLMEEGREHGYVIKRAASPPPVSEPSDKTEV